MSRLMVSISGIRGIVGETLTPEVVQEFAAAFGAWARSQAGEGATVIVGRDSRPTGPMVARAAESGLMAAGCSVVDVGLAPTPTIMLRVGHHGAAGALAVTASHNPAPWNALKLIGPRGMFLRPEEAEAVLARRGGENLVPWDGVGTIAEDSGAVSAHIDAILACPEVDVDAIRAADFRVALDCGRGAGGVLTPRLLEELGCEVIGLDLEPDGRFSRNPEPVPENLGGLCDLVRESGADIGLAHDADVDRLAIVTEDGKAVGEECTLALAVEHVLGLRTGPVVTNLSTSSMVERLAERAGVTCERTPVGEIHVADRLRAIGGAVGGEGNGGVILPSLQFTRDAPAAAALVLSHLARSGGAASALVAALPRVPMLKSKFPLDGPVPADLSERLLSVLPGADVDESDGVRLSKGESWVHVRGSNTEPLLRVIGECPDDVDGLVNRAARAAGARVP